jgi:hypothetical protein
MQKMKILAAGLLLLAGFSCQSGGKAASQQLSVSSPGGGLAVILTPPK